MKNSKINFRNSALYVLMLVYTTSCNLDSFSDPYPAPDQLSVSEETLDHDDEAGANLRLGNLVFEESFAGGAAFSGQSLQFAGTHSFQVTNDPLNSSNKVGKFELRYNDQIVKSSKRSEVGLR